MRTQLEVRRIDLWSLFKISFFLYFALGLVMGLFYGFFILLAGGLQEAFADEFEGLPSLGILGGVLGLILIPVMAMFYGAIGSVFMTIGGMLFNLAAKFAGGIRFDTEVELAEQPPVFTPPSPGPEPDMGDDEPGPTIG